MYQKSNVQLSIVIPVYNAANTIQTLVEQLHEHCKPLNLSYEIILVDDRGPDHSWEVISEICKTDQSVKALQLSRNFGQHPAITAGLEIVKGEFVVVMDCDLQDRPDQIPLLYNHLIQENLDMVLARRVQRQDSFTKRMSSKYFYKTLSYFTNTQQDASVANFGIYRYDTIREVVRMGDFVRFFPLFIRWVGFNIGYLEIQHASREDGGSNYTFRKLWNLALDNIVSFSNKPLYMTINLGIFIIFLSFLAIIVNLYKYFTGQIEIMGYTSTIILFSFFFGVVIFILGVIGIYIAKIFDQVKGRQVYIVKEKLNL